MGRKRGSCVVCGKKYIVNKSGNIGSHSSDVLGEENHGYCLGIDLPPSEVTAQGFIDGSDDALNCANRLQRKLDSKPDYQPHTLERMAKEVDGYRALSLRLKEQSEVWVGGELEDAPDRAKKTDYGDGTCPVCSRVFKLKKDGSIRSHNNLPDTIIAHRECHGSSLVPLETSNEGCVSAIHQLQDKCDYIQSRLDGAPGRTTRTPEKFAEYEPELEYFQYCLENTKRNYEEWNPDQPIPDSPLKPPPRKEKVELFEQQAVSKSGCLGLFVVLCIPALLLAFTIGKNTFV